MDNETSKKAESESAHLEWGQGVDLGNPVKFKNSGILSEGILTIEPTTITDCLFLIEAVAHFAQIPVNPKILQEGLAKLYKNPRFRGKRLFSVLKNEEICKEFKISEELRLLLLTRCLYLEKQANNEAMQKEIYAIMNPLAANLKKTAHIRAKSEVEQGLDK